MVRVYRKGRSYELSDSEYDRKVSGYNAKNGYGFSRADLTRLAEKHYKGDDRTKAILEERLTDANFHKFSEALSDDDYERYEADMNKTYGKPKKRSPFFESLDKAVRDKVGKIEPSKKAVNALKAMASSNG